MMMMMFLGHYTRDEGNRSAAAVKNYPLPTSGWPDQRDLSRLNLIKSFRTEELGTGNSVVIPAFSRTVPHRVNHIQRLTPPVNCLI